MLYKLLIVAHNEMWARKGKIKAKVKKKCPCKICYSCYWSEMSFSQVADKDNTALFRNYAYIATFDFSPPPPKRQLLFWTFLEHSPETGKKILGWILFLLFVQKKKKKLH